MTRVTAEGAKLRCEVPDSMAAGLVTWHEGNAFKITHSICAISQCSNGKDLDPCVHF